MSKVKFKRGTQTSRELRRMAEREAGRQARQKSIDAFWALTPEERAQRMADNEAFQRINRNGITIEDLKKAEDQGRSDGYRVGKEETLIICYASFILAMHELHGFDADQCREVLNLADEKVTYTLTSAEAIREVYEEMGLALNFSEEMPGERVQEKSDYGRNESRGRIDPDELAHGIGGQRSYVSDSRGAYCHSVCHRRYHSV